MDSPNKKQFFSTVLAGCIGAVVGASVSGFISYQSTRAQFREQVRDREFMSGKNERALLEVLKGDLMALRILQSQADSLISNLKADEGFLKFVPVELNYFSVFENSVARLGEIENSELRTQIIFVYQKAKSLIDTLRHNNEILAEFRKWEIENKRSPSAIAKEQVRQQTEKMVEYAGYLKISSAALKKDFESVLATIDLELAKR